MIHNSIQTTVPSQEQISSKRTLKELNLMDTFLFDVSTENPEDAAKIARTIVKRATGQELKEIAIENQKQLQGIDVNKRGIRMDFFIRQKLMQKNSQPEQSLRNFRN